MEAAFIPEVNNELDTQNFEKFDEVLSLLCCETETLHLFCVKNLT